MNRDPATEWAGENLYVLVHNDAIDSVDPLGLVVWDLDGTPKCDSVKYYAETFLTVNPDWQTEIDDFESGDPPCKLNIKCTCCSEKNLKGECSGLSADGVVYMTLCRNNLEDAALGWPDKTRVRMTFAHELVHYFDACNPFTFPSCTAPGLSDAVKRKCKCSKRMCTEMRAFKKEGLCGSYGTPTQRFNSCWSFVKASYWVSTGCSVWEGLSGGYTEAEAKAYTQSNCPLDASMVPAPDYSDGP